MTHMPKIEINLNRGTGSIKLDGHDITAGVRSFELAADCRRRDSVPRLNLELVAVEVTCHTADAELYISDPSRELLIAYGWTPPAKDAQ